MMIFCGNNLGKKILLMIYWKKTGLRILLKIMKIKNIMGKNLMIMKNIVMENLMWKNIRMKKIWNLMIQ